MKSRRDFLKIAGLSAFALGTASALTLATGSKASALPAGTAPAKGSYTNEPDALHAKRWAMVIDTRKFTSPEHFQRVIDACHHAHNVPTIPGNQDIKWLWTDKYAHVFPDDVNAYMDAWAQRSGLMDVPGASPRKIGWDFPFVSPEQKNRFGLRGYVAAWVLPEGFTPTRLIVQLKPASGKAVETAFNWKDIAGA